MPIQRPKEPTGDHPIVAWCRQLLRYVDERTIISFSGGSMDRKESGYVLRIPEATTGGGSSSSVRAVTNVSGFAGDYFSASDIITGEQIFVALPYLLRESSWSGRTYNDGTATVTATKESDGQRRLTKTIGGIPVSEIQKITPSYAFELGDVILIERVGNDVLGGMRTNPAISAADVAVEWTDRNDAARAWAAVAVINGA